MGNSVSSFFNIFFRPEFSVSRLTSFIRLRVSALNLNVATVDGYDGPVRRGVGCEGRAGHDTSLDQYVGARTVQREGRRDPKGDGHTRKGRF